MNTPVYYKKLYALYLRYAIVMVFFGLLMGIVFQESSKKAPFSALLPAGVHLESIFTLALVHGHIFTLGVLIPLAYTWMLHLGLTLNYRPVSEKCLSIGTRLFLPTATLAILLMTYKGYHFLLGVRGGQTNFMVLSQTYFFGNMAAKAAVYGLTHTLMAIGLGTLVVGYWRTIGKEALQANGKES